MDDAIYLETMARMASIEAQERRGVPWRMPPNPLLWLCGACGEYVADVKNHGCRGGS